jgi:hypothetical protein
VKSSALEAARNPDDPVDVLIGHYSHVHKRKVTAGRTVLIDEFPGSAFETTLSTFLDRTPQVPFDDYTVLLERRGGDLPRGSALDFLLQGLDPHGHQVFDGTTGRAYTPLAVYTLLASDDLVNGFEVVEFPDSPRVGVFDRENNRINILTPPDPAYARSVLALDGTPTRELWQRSLGEHLNHRRVLTGCEREEYLTDVLDHQLGRTTDAVTPYAGGQYVNPTATWHCWTRSRTATTNPPASPLPSLPSTPIPRKTHSSTIPTTAPSRTAPPTA